MLLLLLLLLLLYNGTSELIPTCQLFALHEISYLSKLTTFNCWNKTGIRLYNRL